MIDEIQKFIYDVTQKLPLQQFIPFEQFNEPTKYYEFVYRQTNDPVFFIHHVLTPVDINGDPMKLTDYQKEAVYVMQNSQYSAMAWSRQIGKTETVSMILPWFLFAKQEPWIIIAAPSHQQAKDLLHRQQQKIEDSVFLNSSKQIDILDGMIRVRVKLFNKTTERMVEKEIKLEKVSAGDKANKARGKSASLLVVEEQQFVSDEIMDLVVLPMASKKGSKIIQISTPFGTNHFYETMFNKEHYETRIFDYTYGLRQGILDENRIADAKRNPSKFKQEYECSFSANSLTFLPQSLFNDIQQSYLPGSEEQLRGIPNGAKFFMGVDWGGSGQDETVQVVIAAWHKKNELQYKIVDWISYKTNPLQEKLEGCKELYDKYSCSYAYFDSYIGEAQEQLLPQKYKIKQQLISFSQKHKFEMYNNYLIVLESKQLTMPSDDLINGPKFITQSLGLIEKKGQNSQYSSLQPQSKNEHDDYPDALVLQISCQKDKYSSSLQSINLNKVRQKLRRNAGGKYEMSDGMLYYRPDYSLADFEAENRRSDEFMMKKSFLYHDDFADL